MTIDVSTTRYGLHFGNPDVQSVGSLAFGPDGILFVADNAAAKIIAIDVGDSATASAGPINVDQLDSRLAAYLGCGRGDVLIRDMAVHPSTEEVYLSVMRGSGTDTAPVLIKIDAEGNLSEVNLTGVAYSLTEVDSAPASEDERTAPNVLMAGSSEGEEITTPSGLKLRISRDRLRSVTVTDMSYVDGVLLVAGASNEEFSSTLRRIPFPFSDETVSNSLEIFHVSHGRYETAAPIRTFLPYGDGLNVLASYTCTPVVHFSLADLQSGDQAKGRTVAELGAANTPIDMVSYMNGGQEYLLVSNSRHALIKLNCSDLDRQEPLTEPHTPEGAPRQVLPQQGVSRMASLKSGHVLMMQQDESGGIQLRSYANEAL